QQADRASAEQMNEMESAARALGVNLRAWDVGRADQLPVAFAAMADSGMQALVVIQNAFMTEHQGEIVRLAETRRLPAMYQFRRSADAGGLVAYGPSPTDMSRRAARYLDPIPKPATPADPPIEPPSKSEPSIHLKTAKAPPGPITR